MDLISKLRPTKKAPDPNAHHSLDGDEDVPEEYLHPCCQKELQADRKKNHVLGKLREGDRARIALEQRRTALGLTSLPTDDEHLHQHGSGCCGLMKDYPALEEARAARQRTVQRSAEREEEEDAPSSLRRAQESEDEDEEEDEEEEEEEWLRELEGEAGELMEIQRAEMMRRALEYDELRRLGIGFHVEASAGDVLHLVHLRSTVVCHLYDPYSHTCASIDLALESLAPRYPGTRICRLPLKHAGELETRLRLPSTHSGSVPSLLLVIVDGCVVDTCGDFRRFGVGEEVQEETLEQWLSYGHALIREPPSLSRAREYVRKAAGKVGGLLRRSDGKAEEGEGDDEEYYECGLEGCRKAFAHNHIGLTELPTALRGS